MDLGHLLRNYLRAGRSPNAQGWVSCRCPFHADRTPSFGVNVISGIAHCYKCGSFSIKRVMDRVGVPAFEQTQILATLPKRKPRREGREGHWDTLIGTREALGLPPEELTFLPENILNRMIPDRALFEGIPDSFTDDTLRHFGVVYDPVEDRTCWPIRDEYGRLVAISGRRSVNDPEIRRIGKYKLYNKELAEVAPYGYTPQNKKCLFHYEEVYPSAITEKIDIILVEGFKAAAWLYQCGFANVVALMGNKLSVDQQLLLLRMTFDSVILFLDNNEAGEIGAYTTYKALSPYHNVLFAPYLNPEASQPDDLEEELVIEALQQPQLYLEWTMNRRNIRRPVAPRSNNSSKMFRKMSDLFRPGELEKEGRTKARIRLIPGDYTQTLFDYLSEQTYEQKGLPYYFHTQYWPAYKAHPDLVPYNNMTWGGPLESTAGPDEKNPEPCFGRYLNDIIFIRPDGTKSRASTRRDMALVGLVDLDWFHAVDRTSQSGRQYTETVRCKKDPVTGRGRCEMCDQGLHREFGKRMYWDMRDFELNQLLDFDERTLATKGACGCSVFLEKYTCSNCKGTMMDLEQMNLSDDQAIEWGAIPQSCPSCGALDHPVPYYGCTGLNERDEEITNCPGVRTLSIWEVDLYVSTYVPDGKDRKELKFELAGTGLVPSARGVNGWAERWEKLCVPWDFEQIIQNERKTLQQQAEKIGIRRPHPFEDLIRGEGLQASSMQSTQGPATRPPRSAAPPPKKNRVRFDGDQDNFSDDDDIPF